MGQAKLRGTREQRIAQAIERNKLEAAALHARYVREEEERRAKLAAVPAEQRQASIRRGSHNRLMLAALGAALAMPPLK